MGILFKHVKDAGKIYRLLAMDGLLGSDPKKYIGNLKYSFYGEGDVDSQEIHVRAIRFLYSELSSVENAFQVIHKMLYDFFLKNGVALPEKPSLQDGHFETLAEMYVHFVGDETFQKILKSLDIGNDKHEHK
ncbi:hypothetical protein AVEN_142881-1 [Araneus ventricosus]|uniref:Uncharacterized protein n=1 Tax=Araneus ventricosus TaxID=182803 RepID=A0A4Y2VPI2_ARAVE|nr:hypothetical protein AVEN_183090-1 [Araneus ventricosus]GBO37980.1 hypothetical protein AVEN_142881-1 [Araneus ventricosus]